MHFIVTSICYHVLERSHARVLELVAYHGAVANVLWAVGDGGWGEDGDGGAEGLHA